MTKVVVTSHLGKFFPGLRGVRVPGKTVRDLVKNLDKKHPGVARYLLDDQNRLRQHVNIFVGDEMIEDRETLRDRVGSGKTVSIIQALSGG